MKTNILIIIAVGLLLLIIIDKSIKRTYSIQDIFMLEKKMPARKVMNILSENIILYDVNDTSSKKDIENVIKHLVILIHLMIKINYTDYHIDAIKSSLTDYLTLLNNQNSYLNVFKKNNFKITNEEIEDIYNKIKIEYEKKIK